ncbi:TPA: hypothetical protein N0F65_004970 [Lagenidium giganteum]|uniref:DDE-1 domain-containing protein n=1 Tax=Lagenidium giganteum TaxID=4803 RepID=A0AAV2YLV2_9STRA|nr:TPA: hypothetical protein N0F65_004970 [Lagenidium giganteum]
MTQDRASKTSAEQQDLSFSQKSAIVASPTWSQGRLCECVFGLLRPPSRGTIQKILNGGDKRSAQPQAASQSPCQQSTTRRQPSAMVSQTEAAGIIMTDAAITVKARKLLPAFETTSKLELTKVWLQTFRVGFGLRCRTLHVKLSSADGSRPRIVFQEWMVRRLRICGAGGFTGGSVWSQPAVVGREVVHYENAAAVNCFPSAQQYPHGRPWRKREASRHKAFSRVIRWFLSPCDIGHAYTHNKNAWMNRKVYTQWIQAFDTDVRNQGRQILLLLDNFSDHYIHYQPTNIAIKFLHKNATSRAQPLDAGILQHMIMS